MRQHLKWLALLRQARLQLTVMHVLISVTILAALTLLAIQQESKALDKALILSHTATLTQLKQNTLVEYALTGTWPTTQLRSIDGAVANQRYQLDHIKTQNGHFTATYQQTKADNNIIIHYQRVTGNYPDMISQWVCGYRLPRQDEATLGPNQTNIDPNLLSQHCKRIKP
ncbi:MAG: hypothetical protein HOM11_01970 [Methylococcales bacterium]|jgi:hypothetical protein|nr:hypothetical protein [Methylococcales bacterium]MBT7442910.1 hypothetical protein [Methylococcales bacterium]